MKASKIIIAVIVLILSFGFIYYRDSCDEKVRGVSNEEYYFNFTIFLWRCYFIFCFIVVCSNGFRDKKHPL